MKHQFFHLSGIVQLWINKGNSFATALKPHPKTGLISGLWLDSKQFPMLSTRLWMIKVWRPLFIPSLSQCQWPQCCPPHHYLHRDLLPTIFRINFSGYYSPHPAYPCDSLHYVRKPDLKKKRGRPPKLRESMSEMPFVPGLGFPLSSGGFYHPSYSVPYSSGPLGLGYYRGYPPASALYPHPHHQNPHSAPSAPLCGLTWHASP